VRDGVVTPAALAWPYPPSGGAGHGVRRLARSTTVFGAAIVASVIAVAAAVQAWLWLQQPAGPTTVLSGFVSEVVLPVALPLLAVALVVGLRRAARSAGPGARGKLPGLSGE
jgi:hypothetical protein